MEDGPEKEFRIYSISGELSTEHWATLLERLRNLGVSSQIVPPDEKDVPASSASSTAEIEHNNEQLLNRSDFLDFADRQGMSHAIAGRAWGTLTQLHDLKVNPEYWDIHLWYDHSRYENIPLVFNTVPQSGRHRHSAGDRFRQRLADLQMSSLEELLKMVDDSVKKYGKQGIANILGRNSGPAIVKFLHDFVADKHGA